MKKKKLIKKIRLKLERVTYGYAYAHKFEGLEASKMNDSDTKRQMIISEQIKNINYGA